MANTYPENPLKPFFQLIRLEKKEIYSIYFFAILSGLVSLTLPLGVQAIISFLMGGALSVSLVVLIVVVVGGVLLNGIFSVYKMRINESIQQHIFVRFAFNLTQKLLHVDLHSVEGINLPEMTNRFFEVSSVQKSFAKILLDFPAATFQVFFSLILLSLYSPVFLLFGILLIILLIMVVRYTAPLGMASSLEESSHKYDQAHWLEEMARNILVFRTNLQSNLSLLRTEKHTSEYLKAREKHFRVLKIQYASVIAFKVLITAILLIIGTALFLNQQLNLGQFIVVDIVIIALVDSIEKIIINLDGIYDLLTSLQKVSYITSKEDEKNGNTIFPTQKTGIRITFSDVSFKYNEHMPLVLKNISFEIASNEKIGIFSVREGGRNTLLKLVAGHFGNYQGDILADGMPISSLDKETYRRDIGLLLFQDHIFEGTLLENVTLQRSGIDTAKVMEIAALTGLDRFIAECKHGLDTMMDSMVIRISEKERKRLLLTRLLVADPRLLLIQDFWSDLDEVSTARIIGHLFSSGSKATLVIASRSAAVLEKCDRIIVLEEGKCVGEWTPDTFKGTSFFNQLMH